MFKSLGDTLNRMSQDLTRGAQTVQEELTKGWQDVKVSCPSCNAMLAVPPNACVFACGQCGTRINAPSLGSVLDHHLHRASSRIEREISKVAKTTKQVGVTAPPGSQAGDTLHVQLGPGAPLVSVVVPQGVQPGQTFAVAVPAHAVPEPPHAAQAEAAPSDVPVGMPVQGTPAPNSGATASAS
eukprot:CAMPEP_0179240010 /NCGR_PEP_ID=MMETSP0797-20121207/15756_1 /TAXON_ID=47934 /ORGANISM="Dinophysis acuminata, Strain DAEP01" /LENGTH=182 /DNA_ID=CAMNT_0020947351 /DNA_START=76 /DNA_END=624 /DNA_ORIENTATION=-